MKWVPHINCIPDHYIYIIHNKSDIKQMKEKPNKEPEEPPLKAPRPVSVCAATTHTITRVRFSSCLRYGSVPRTYLRALLPVCPSPPVPSPRETRWLSWVSFCMSDMMQGPDWLGWWPRLHMAEQQAEAYLSASGPPLIHSLPPSSLAVPPVFFLAYCELDWQGKLWLSSITHMVKHIVSHMAHKSFSQVFVL